MITSEDVRRVTFDRAMRGYRCEDVDDYLKQVADSMDALAAANAEQQKKLVLLAQSVAQYRAEEDTLRTTMLNAQRMGDNVIHEAKQSAAEIIRNANIKAEDRERSAQDAVELARQEIVTLKKEADAFKKNLLDMYSKHIKLLSKIPEYAPESVQPADAQPEPAAAPAAQPAAEPAYQTPVYQPPVYQPAPPVQEPVYQPAEPVYQPEPPYQEPGYQEPSSYYEQPLGAEPEKPVDTVEIAISPSGSVSSAAAATAVAEPVVSEEEVPDSRFNESVAGLYGAAEPAAAPKKTVRSKKTRAKKPAAAPAEELPEAYDGFKDLGYDS